jgi:hypothetical protein
MKLRPSRVLAGALVAIVAWVAISWYVAPERQIGRRLRRVQRLVAKAPGESDIAGLAAARSLSELFADSFTVRAEPRGFSLTDRQSLAAAVHRYRRRATTVVMEISDTQFFFDDTRSSANTYFSARFISDLGDLASEERFDFRVHWIDTDRGWAIDNVLVSGVDSLP